MIIGSRNIKKIASLLALLSWAAVANFSCIEAKTEEGLRNVILIGWDGADRRNLLRLLADKQLPNLERLISEGSLVQTEVTTAKTHTKPGWAEILTGYNAELMGIRDNSFYKPIPEGYTVFERVKRHFAMDGIKVIFIVGKNNNLGARGRHEICMNCFRRDPVMRLKTFYWDKELCKAKTLDGKPKLWVRREGEPYFYSRKAFDYYAASLGQAENVAGKALFALDKYRSAPFFAFLHFEEPDEQGHVYGEGLPEYTKAFKTADYWLGVIMDKLRKLGIYNKTTIYVTSDHGMDKGGFEHSRAPHTFLATNNKRRLRNGDRKDITPTILAEYGLDLNSINPPLEGKPLFADDKR